MGNKGRSKEKSRPVVEWLVGSLSALVVFAILAFLTYEALFGDTRPPDLIATIDRVENVEGGTLVVVTLSNRGDQAAAGIAVEAVLEGARPSLTRQEIRFDYVASHAVRQGAFVIDEPAIAAQDVRLRVHGYVEP